MKYNILYQTRNLINNNTYIGIHIQKIKPHLFDGYLGSGKLLKLGILKYGKDNFIRETLEVFDTYHDARIRERELVDFNFVSRCDTYNISLGGTGGNTQPNRTPKDNVERNIKILNTRKANNTLRLKATTRLNMSINAKKRVIEKPWTLPNNKNRVIQGQGLKNIQDAGIKRRDKFIWITNGINTKMIGINDDIPETYYQGRGDDVAKCVSHTIETREKISNHPNIKGVRCYTNGDLNLKLKNTDEVPFGFYKGVTIKTKPKIRITNGFLNKSIAIDLPIPEGWYRGLTRKII